MIVALFVTDPGRYAECAGVWERLGEMELELGCRVVEEMGEIVVVSSLLL